MKPLKGETLVSLLISLGLSALLLLLVAQFYAQTQQQNQRLMLQLKLQAELQRTIQLIGKDLRRVGFRAASQIASCARSGRVHQDRRHETDESECPRYLCHQSGPEKRNRTR